MIKGQFLATRVVKACDSAITKIAENKELDIENRARRMQVRKGAFFRRPYKNLSFEQLREKAIIEMEDQGWMHSYDVVFHKLKMMKKFAEQVNSDYVTLEVDDFDYLKGYME